MLESISGEDLLTACGGINMRLTQYGYPGDRDGDSYTRRGLGAYRHLQKDTSVALTDSGLAALGLTRRQVTRGQYFIDIRMKGGGVLTRRIDDRSPQRFKGVDLYQKGGLNRRLPDYADISLHHG
jgi:hypothetical protein